MQSSVKLNSLATVSLVSGLTVLALLSIGLYWLLFPSSPGYSDTIRTLLDLSVTVQYICASLALLTGVLALWAIKKKAGTEKGKILAWVGILIGAGYVSYGLLVFIIFSAQFLV